MPSSKAQFYFSDSCFSASSQTLCVFARSLDDYKNLSKKPSFDSVVVTKVPPVGNGCRVQTWIPRVLIAVPVHAN